LDSLSRAEKYARLEQEIRDIVKRIGKDYGHALHVSNILSIFEDDLIVYHSFLQRAAAIEKEQPDVPTTFSHKVVTHITCKLDDNGDIQNTKA